MKKKVLENKSSNAITWKDKEKAWEEIELEYNSQTMGSVFVSKQYNIGVTIICIICIN